MDDTRINNNKKKPQTGATPNGKIQVLFSVITEEKGWEQSADGSQKQITFFVETFYVGGHVKKPIQVFKRKFDKRLKNISYTLIKQFVRLDGLLNLEEPISTYNLGNKIGTGNEIYKTKGEASNQDPCFGYIQNKGNRNWECSFKYTKIDSHLMEDIDVIRQISTDWFITFVTSEKDKQSKFLQKEYHYRECNYAEYLGSGFFLKSPETTGYKADIFDDFLRYILWFNTTNPVNKPKVNQFDNHYISPINISFTLGQNSDTFSIAMKETYISFTKKEFSIVGSSSTQLQSSNILMHETSNVGGVAGNIYGWTGIKFVASWEPTDLDADPPRRIYPMYNATDLIAHSVQDGYLVPEIDLSLLKKTDAYKMPYEMSNNYFLYQPFYYIFPESRWPLPTFFGGKTTTKNKVDYFQQVERAGVFFTTNILDTMSLLKTDESNIIILAGTSAAGELIETMVPEYGPSDGSLSFGISAYDPPGTLPHYLLVKGFEFIPRGISTIGTIENTITYKSRWTSAKTKPKMIFHGGFDGIGDESKGSIIRMSILQEESYKEDSQDRLQNKSISTTNPEYKRDQTIQWVISSNKQNNMTLSFSRKTIIQSRLRDNIMSFSDEYDYDDFDTWKDISDKNISIEDGFLKNIITVLREKESYEKAAVLLEEINPRFTQVDFDFYNVLFDEKIEPGKEDVWIKDVNYKVAEYKYKKDKYEKKIEEYKVFSLGYNEKNKPKTCMIHAYSFHPN